MSDRAPPVLPRIETETARADRLEPALDRPAPADEPDALAATGEWGMPALVLAGGTVLASGLVLFQVWVAVAALSAHSPLLGGLGLAVAATGAGLVLLGIARELRAYARIGRVDRIRRDLNGHDPVRRAAAARRWLDLVGAGSLRPALDAINDPDAVLPLLRAGAEAALRARAEARARRAAFEVVAGMAAAPAPALAVLLVSWRGLRLIRDIATIYGLRPGVFGTIALLRRTVTAATATAVTEAAVNTAAHAVLSTPLLTHLAGEMAGGAVAARRMIVLGRAASVGCSPLPPE